MRITNDFKYVKCLLMKHFQVVSLMMNVFNTATVNNLCFSFFFFCSSQRLQTFLTILHQIITLLVFYELK